MSRRAPAHSRHRATPAKRGDGAKKKAPTPTRTRTRKSPQRPTGWRRLRVVPQADGPHGRLGLAFAVVSSVLTLIGAVPIGVWMAAHAGLAVVQAERTWDAPAREALAAGIGAGLFAFSCSFGLIGAAVGAAVAASAAAVVTANEGRIRIRSVVTALLLGAAAGSVPLARTMGPVPGVFLLGLMCAYDTGNYVVGTGAKNVWEGPAAGIAAMGPVTVMGATLAVPPFTETGPWILGAIGAVTAPIGPYAGSALLGKKSKSVRLPALRRLDALIVLGPAWCGAAYFL